MQKVLKVRHNVSLLRLEKHLAQPVLHFTLFLTFNLAKKKQQTCFFKHDRVPSDHVCEILTFSFDAQQR